MLIAKSRPIYPLFQPKVIWNGESGALDALLNENSTSESVLQLAQQEMSNATTTTTVGLKNLTEGQALAA